MNVGIKHNKPKKQIIFVSRGEENTALRNTSGYWVFGTRTKHAWPSGDFIYYSNGRKMRGSSVWLYDEVVDRADLVRYDPDLQVDEGL